MFLVTFTVTLSLSHKPKPNYRFAKSHEHQLKSSHLIKLTRFNTTYHLPTPILNPKILTPLIIYITILISIKIENSRKYISKRNVSHPSIIPKTTCHQLFLRKFKCRVMLFSCSNKAIILDQTPWPLT